MLPVGSKIHYDFPERGDRPPVRLTWYDGGLKPKRPEELPDRVDMDFGYGGILYVGDKGKIITSALGDRPQIIPLEKMESFSPPKYLHNKIQDFGLTPNSLMPDGLEHQLTVGEVNDLITF